MKLCEIISINKTPQIKSYLHHAFLFSIVSGDNRDSGWIISNYLQLQYHDSEIEVERKLDFFHKHWFAYFEQVEINYLRLKTLKAANISKIDYIISEIRLGYCVEAFVDEYYISEHDGYKKFHYNHTILIYGFDLRSEEFFIMGYKNRSYSSSKLPFKNFECAFRKALTSMKIAENANFNFDPRIAYQLISDYLTSENTRDKFCFYETTQAKSNYFGLNIYARLKCDVINNKIDIRSFSVLEEHKICISKLSKYLVIHTIDFENNSLLIESDATELNETAKILKKLALKTVFTTNINLCQKIIKYIDKCVEIELRLLPQLLTKLKQQL